eukprot:tig00021682_g23092.t1
MVQQFDGESYCIKTNCTAGQEILTTYNCTNAIDSDVKRDRFVASDPAGYWFAAMRPVCICQPPLVNVSNFCCAAGKTVVNGACADPPTPSPSPSPSATPSASPSPSSTPSPSATPSPAALTTPSPTPATSPSATAAATPSPSPSPSPTATPKPPRLNITRIVVQGIGASFNLAFDPVTNTADVRTPVVPAAAGVVYIPFISAAIVGAAASRLITGLFAAASVAATYTYCA